MNTDIVQKTYAWRVFRSLFVMVFCSVLGFAITCSASRRVKAGTDDNAAASFNAGCGIAAIDGVVSASEWSGASTRTVNLVPLGGESPFTASISVMNSPHFLFMGLTINDDEYTTWGNYLPEGDEFIIVFDHNRTGSIFDLKNNVLALAAGSPQFEDRYMYTETGSNQADLLDGGTANGRGASRRDGGLNHFELMFPLCTGDQLDFCLGPSDAVGFRLEYLDAQGDNSFGGSQWYPGTSSDAQVDLVIGTCTNLPDIFIYLPTIQK